MQLTGEREPNFIRKNIAPLTGSEVNLLSDETVQKLICYTPKETKLVEHYTIGHLLGATDNQIPFTVNVEKSLILFLLIQCSFHERDSSPTDNIFLYSPYIHGHDHVSFASPLR